ncbi:hypothetical protein B0T25DRAFT_530226 [Lasiosphaeria hispida]|uniref:Secreted protein n=1 Tax=Lasiosphaeria hispida TaxID=260671 RepID=A0AAJ0HXF4_9PEZI|nr:hypothetical protein B0T25DRAFT_530226 [Lasiosphaeria hispida]
MMLPWIGWLGFNGGSALGGNMRAGSACTGALLVSDSVGVRAPRPGFGRKAHDRFLVYAKHTSLSHLRTPRLLSDSFSFCLGTHLPTTAWPNDFGNQRLEVREIDEP